MSTYSGSFRAYIDDWYEVSANRLRNIGLMGGVGYPLFWLIWKYYGEPYENMALRLVGSALCLFMATHKCWHRRLHRYRGLFLFIFTTYCLPFFFGYMLLKNDFSLVWIQSYLASIFILIVFANWRLMGLMYATGTGLALTVFLMTEETHNVSSIALQGKFVFVYLFLILFASYFNRLNEVIRREKDRALHLQAVHLTHEIKRPIAAITLGLVGLWKFSEDKEVFDNEVEKLKKECKDASTLFDLFKINATPRANIDKAKFEYQSINECIEKVMSNYPYLECEKEWVKWEKGEDWSFYGSGLLTRYALMNLLKNSFDSVMRKGTGSVTIRTEQEKGYNLVSVRDTGEGIPKERLSRVFDKFYTSKEVVTGTGVGLAFVEKVMKAQGGRVTCQSEPGEYAHFTLYFPELT